MVTEQLVITALSRPGAVVVTPVGRLDVRTYRQLRDALLKYAADDADGLIVDVNALDLPIDRPVQHGGIPSPRLSVFTAVWAQLSTWPGIPVHLVAAGGPMAAQLSVGALPRFVPVHRELSDALAAVAAPPPRRRTRLRIPAGSRSARAARVLVAETIEAWNLTAGTDRTAGTDCTAGTDRTAAPSTEHRDEVVDDGGEWALDVALVASELVENVLRHARSDALLRLELRPGHLSVAVSDDDPRPPRLVTAADADVIGGRGLAVVDQIARVWGHRPRPRGGKVVWAVLAARSR